jgi:hypothetical protein
MRLRALRLALALLLAFGTACTGKKAEESVPASPLYTGQEPKRDVLLFLPAKDKPGFAQVKRQVYATASVVAQGKQLLRLLMDGPLADGTETGLAALFAPGAAYAELYLDGRGLAVLDLPTATVQALPGCAPFPATCRR